MRKLILVCRLLSHLGQVTPISGLVLGYEVGIPVLFWFSDILVKGFESCVCYLRLGNAGLVMLPLAGKKSQIKQWLQWPWILSNARERGNIGVMERRIMTMHDFLRSRVSHTNTVHPDLTPQAGRMQCNTWGVLTPVTIRLDSKAGTVTAQDSAYSFRSQQRSRKAVALQRSMEQIFPSPQSSGWDSIFPQKI